MIIINILKKPDFEHLYIYIYLLIYTKNEAQGGRGGVVWGGSELSECEVKCAGSSLKI